MNKHLAMAAAIASFGIVGATAPLDDADSLQVRSVSVPYDRSEIRDGRSAENLFFRIRQTAEEVCRISPHPRGYEIWSEHDCEAEAVDQAVRAADIPVLDQYYDEVGTVEPTRR
ncbi:MAG: UrcA family protein [Pseudomonadota bacterium]|nr:UrcA family protein [Pseudomonadota bacterium]